MITVVAALIEKNEKFLIAKRLTGSQEVLGKWEFPGGKVEHDETEENALIREIKEEFEIDIQPTIFLVNSIWNNSKNMIDLRLYKCNFVSGCIRLHDHSEYIFVDKQNLTSYDLCPADIPLAIYVEEMK